MKRYHIKKTILIRLQGAMLILLAYAAHKVNSDAAALLFAVMGITMLLHNVHILARCLYKISKYFYRKLRWIEFPFKL